MIILEKKKIITWSLLFFICIFAFSITVNRMENTVQTVALPVTDKVIVIDAGHRSSRRRCTK